MYYRVLNTLSFFKRLYFHDLWRVKKLVNHDLSFKNYNIAQILLWISGWVG